MDAATVPIDENALDEQLELDVAVQRRILEFEASLNLPYHELLGVPRGSDPKVVKRAYFKLSKEFHPDRYFRREIGDYTARLERIFKKVLEAHEMLSDPDLCQVENQPSVDVPPPPVDAAQVPKKSAAPETPAQDGPPAREAEKARPVSKLERLRQRMPFKIDPKVILARRAKADDIFRSAMLSQRSGRRQEAESSIRIAISFDPNRAEFKEALGALRLEAAGDRAAKLLASPSDRMSDGELRDALRLLEDVLLYRPHDPQLNERAARVCMQLRKFDDAIEYAKTLIEGSPEDAKHHTLHGLILKGKGDSSAAVKALETALKYDGENVEARRALAALRIGHHDSVQGGRT
jgi:curved DNA-binding protein CbpA